MNKTREILNRLKDNITNTKDIDNDWFVKEALNTLKELEKQLTLTDVVSSCNVTYKKGFRGLCKCCKGDGWINND